MEPIESWDWNADPGMELIAGGRRWSLPRVQIVMKTEIDAAPAFWAKAADGARLGAAWRPSEAAAIFASGEGEDGWSLGGALRGVLIAGARMAYAEEGEDGGRAGLFRRWAAGRRGVLQIVIAPASDATDRICLAVHGLRSAGARAAVAAHYQACAEARIPPWAWPVDLAIGPGESRGTGRNRYTLHPLVLTRGAPPARSAAAAEAAAILGGWREGEGAAWRAEWDGLPE